MCLLCRQNTQVGGVQFIQLGDNGGLIPKVICTKVVNHLFQLVADDAKESGNFSNARLRVALVLQSAFVQFSHD